MQTVTKTEVKAAVEILKAVADAIRELGEVPSGHLYANLMSKLSLAQFEQVLGVLKGAGLVRESNAHLLTWIEPEATA
jgi:DNA-binding transcriptional ArsR family regulator